jgi:cellulose synthase/poly-beta-1,6-N-acetylglucosamine synthase-like glycosyltransferase
MAMPSLDSWSERLLRHKGKDFETGRLCYFDRQTIQHLLFRTGYHRVVIRPDRKALDGHSPYQRSERFALPGPVSLKRWASHFTPEAFRRRGMSFHPGGNVVMACAKEGPQKRKLSVIVPAYNEVATFRRLMEPLVQKEIDGLDMEITVVESNSTDGTREEVLRYQDHPRVKIILEDRPRGKGHAVRAALEHITGDFVLIQDADLEYDLNDYEALLEPLRNYREAFVLGARHQGSNPSKIRDLEEQPFLSLFMNLGHVLFTTLLNLFYGQRLRDPLTMYKVFRRDCLHGLTFECDRFDFDYELVIKLIRKGYRPVEIPVNYRPRSFAEGKKISVLRDPLTWIRALVVYRFQRVEAD